MVLVCGLKDGASRSYSTIEQKHRLIDLYLLGQLATQLQDAQSRLALMEAKKTATRNRVKLTNGDRMLVIVITAILMLGMLDRAVRVGRLELLRLNAHHEILALRDSLQNAALTRVVEPNNPLYRLCARILNSTVNELLELRFYNIVARVLIGEQYSYSRIERELQKPENSRYKSILDGFSGCVANLHRKQHVIVFPLSQAIFSFMGIKTQDSGQFTWQEVKEALRSPRLRDSAITRQYC